MNKFLQNLMNSADFNSIKQAAQQAVETLGGPEFAGKVRQTAENFSHSDIGAKIKETANDVKGSDTATQLRHAAQDLTSGGMGKLLGAGAIGALLGSLLSGKTAGKLIKSAILVGGSAVAGKMALDFYRKWSGTENADAGTGLGALPSDEKPTTQLSTMSPQAEETALLLLQALVFAARADGHIDEQERSRIDTTLKGLFENDKATELLDLFMSMPLETRTLAEKVKSREQGEDLYRMSCVIIDVDNQAEREYLNRLAADLGITTEKKISLEQEAQKEKQRYEQ